MPRPARRAIPRNWLLGAILAATLLMAASPLGRAADEPTKPDPNNTGLVAHGKAVYTEQCASCHGANLEGEPNWQKRRPNGRLPAPPHDRTGHTWHHSDRQLFDMVKNGTAASFPR